MITPLRRHFNLSHSHATRQLSQPQDGLNESLGEAAHCLLSKERMAAFIFQQDVSMGQGNKGVRHDSHQRNRKWDRFGQRGKNL